MASPSDPRTHLGVDPRLCGEPIALGDGAAEVRLVTRAEMAADRRGLVHGGFVFGLADYAAMLAVNHPNVVLGAAEARFLKHVVVGETLLARALAAPAPAAKVPVKVQVFRTEGPSQEDLILEGSFTCFVLGNHVLDSPKA